MFSLIAQVNYGRSRLCEGSCVFLVTGEHTYQIFSHYSCMPFPTAVRVTQWDMEAFNKPYTKLSYTETLQTFVEDAAEYGLLVMLDLHHLVENAGGDARRPRYSC